MPAGKQENLHTHMHICAKRKTPLKISNIFYHSLPSGI